MREKQIFPSVVHCPNGCISQGQGQAEASSLSPASQVGGWQGPQVLVTPAAFPGAAVSKEAGSKMEQPGQETAPVEEAGAADGSLIYY